MRKCRAVNVNTKNEWNVAVAWALACEGMITLRRMSPRIHVANTEKDLLDELYTLTGFGRVQPRHFSPRVSKKAKPQWEWIVDNPTECALILHRVENILPSARKREVAKLVLEICARKPYSKFTAYEHWIKDEVRRLNKRGEEN